MSPSDTTTALLGLADKGACPPFSDTGLSSVVRHFQVHPDNAAESVRTRGLVAHWPLDPAAIADLLPEPLAVDPEDRNVWFVARQSEQAIGPGRPSWADVEETRWHEAAIMLPYVHDGKRGLFTWIRFHERDAAMLAGAYLGVPTKQARFTKTFPFVGQPLNRAMGVGTGCIMVASRFDARVFTARFKAHTEHDPSSAEAAALRSRLERVAGIRYLPDWARPGSPAPVNDVVSWEVSGIEIASCFAGDLDLALASSDEDELGLVSPADPASVTGYFLDWSHGPTGPVTVVGGRPTEQLDGVRRAASGVVLQGASTPLSPSGNAAISRSTDLGGKLGVQLRQAGHVGMYVHWRADIEGVRKILPPPFEVTEESDRIWLFMNQTQSGINQHGGHRPGPPGYLADREPHHVNWHEAMFRIPCAVGGKKGYLLHVQYKDQDHALVFGMIDGYTTKRADFREYFRLYNGNGDGELAPGDRVGMHVSRHGAPIITAHLAVERELPEEERESEGIRIFGVRHFPDLTTPQRDPLVHDIISWKFANRRYRRAWAGNATITFGDSDREELHNLEPVEMLESLFVHLEYQSGPGTGEILHDYLDA
ncbi:acetoacetate decarboxylase family protein [Nocardioides bigeumensis]|uniref:Terminase n=1 Tax=Nocardioides bigeumensis TaxID=433657 RepID=A0ABP5JVM1_9ACTN